MERRTRRALAVIGLALVVIAVVAIVELRPRPPTTATRPAPPATLSAASFPCDPAFGDALHGVVMLCEPGAALRKMPFVTDDGGRTWRRVPVLLAPDGYARWFDASHAVIEGDGVRNRRTWLTADAGRTWVIRSAAPEPAQLNGASLPEFADPKHALQLYSLMPFAGPGSPAPGPPSAELWRTDDGGATWLRLPAAGLSSLQAWYLLMISSPQTAFMLVRTADASAWPQLWRTDDGSRSWQPTALTIPPPSHVATQFAPFGLLKVGQALVFWVETSVSGPLRLLLTSVSEDGGKTFSPFRPGPETSGSRLLSDNHTLFLADSGNLWWTRDSGQTWDSRPVPRNYELTAAASGALFAFSFSPAGRATALLRSPDDGVTWQPIALPRVSAPAARLSG